MNSTTGRPVTPFSERFWKKVEIGGPDECWLWAGGVNPDGYGVASVYVGKGLPHRKVYAHRAALALDLGCEIDAVDCACHSCDTPRCCNPAHLFHGTRADNNADKMAKCRHEHGERHHKAKLTDGAVREIRRRSQSTRRLAAEFGVSASVISEIKNRKAWAHVE